MFRLKKVIKITEHYNENLVPYTRCRKSPVPPRDGTTKAIIISLDTFTVDEWKEAIDECFELRGLVESTRLSLVRFTDSVRGVSLLERILNGEYESWKRPAAHIETKEPSLEDIIFHEAVPVDWLSPPPGMVSRASSDDGLKYCVRMLHSSPYLLAWLQKKMTGKSLVEIKKTRLWSSMMGLLDPLLLEGGWSFQKGEERNEA